MESPAPTQSCMSEGGAAAELSAVPAPGTFVSCVMGSWEPGQGREPQDHPDCQGQAKALLFDFVSFPL